MYGKNKNFGFGYLDRVIKGKNVFLINANHLLGVLLKRYLSTILKEALM